jgi:hypothetical protein
LSEKFEAIDDCGLNRVKKNEMTENFSLLGYNPAKKYEKNEPEMTSKIGDPREDMI